MKTPKRTLFTLLVAALLAASGLTPLASPALAAGTADGGPASVTASGPWPGGLSALVERLTDLFSWPAPGAGEEAPAPFLSPAGGSADPPGPPSSGEDDEDGPVISTQEGVIADPNG